MGEDHYGKLECFGNNIAVVVVAVVVVVVIVIVFVATAITDAATATTGLAAAVDFNGYKRTAFNGFVCATGCTKSK